MEDEPESIVSTASPEVLLGQLGMALLDVLDAASAEAPVLVQIDDLQWADPSLKWLWDEVLTWAATYPVALLFAFRTSAHDQPSLNVPSVPVASLDTATVAELMDELLARAGRALEPETREALLARAAGSP